MEASKRTRVVFVGGGHCNCLALKLLKENMPANCELILVSEAPLSYYSGMLPGASARLYKDEDIQIQLAPLAKWCGAQFIEKRVKEVKANDNKLLFEDGSTLSYDVLALNVGSKTRGAFTIPGVWEHSLTTRPINELLGKIQSKEEHLLRNSIIPRVVVCGGGAAGVELSFAFKARWT